jgi:hypothetical protein
MSIILDTHDAFFLLYESVLILREQSPFQQLLIDKIIVSQDKQIEIMWKFTPELRVVS